jgi:hypothetical protein
MKKTDKDKVKELFKSKNVIIEFRHTSKNVIILKGKIENGLKNFQFSLVEVKEIDFQFLLVIEGIVILNDSCPTFNGVEYLLKKLNQIKNYIK